MRLAAFLLLLPLAARAVAPADRMQFADGLFSRGLHDLAAKEYLALATNAAATNLDVVLFRAAECYRLLGNRASAAEYYRRVADEHPDSGYAGRAAFRHAEITVTGGQYIEAVNRFRALVDRHPPPEILAPALYYLGYAQKKMKLPDEAVAALRRLLKEFPESPYAVPACVDLADLLAQAGGDDAEIRDLLQRAAARGKGERAGAEALYRLGNRAFRQGDFGASADAYAALLQEHPAEARAQEARLPAAWALFRAGRAAEALAVVEPAVQDAEGGQQAEWLYLQANCLRHLDRKKDALQAYDRLTGGFAASDLAQAALYETAVMAFQEKDHARAYELALAAQPAADLAPDVLWLRAEAARASGRADAALEHYEKMTAEFPAHERTAAARFQAARLLQERGEHEAASARYRALARERPDDPLAADALFASAYCRVVLKQHAEAVADWDALIAGHPSFATLDEALYGKAQAEVEVQRDGDALKTLERMLKEFPRSRLAAEAHYLMGSLLERQEKYEVAEYHYRMATLKKPEPSLVRKIEFRRVAVLQRQGHHDDAAAVLNVLVSDGAGAQVPPALLDWLVRWNLAKEKFEDAERGAEALAGTEGNAAWQQIGWYFVGRSRQASGRAAGAREAFARAMAIDARTREGAEAAVHLGDVAAGEKDWAAAHSAYAAAAERAASEDVADIRARSYFGMGRASAALGNQDDAARYFMSVAVLYDDPELAPEALFRAAEAFDETGRAEDRDRARAELRQRYPDSAWSARLPGP